MILSRRGKRVVLAAGVAAVVVAVIGAVFARLADRERERRQLAAERADFSPAPPGEHVVRTEAPRHRRTYAAELAPERLARVPSEVPGVVVAVNAEPGQPVRAGDVLARLDDRRARIAMEAVEARQAEAERLFREAERLRSSRVVSETAMEAARAEARQQAALLAEARDHLERHTVRAPFDGFVNAREVEVGSAVTAHQPVAVVVDLSKLRVRFHVDEAEAGAFREGTKVRVRIPALGGEAREVPIIHAAKAADPVTGLFLIEARLENPDARIPGGIRGVVEAEIPACPPAPLVPAAAVRFRDDRATVLRRPPGGEVEEVEVVVGAEVRGFYPVLEGLKEGDRVLFR